jgi:hypothetical protein
LQDLKIAADSSKLSRVFVASNVSTIGSNHPTMDLLKKRLEEKSKPSNRENDSETIALCVEGGGMRGCVSAGAAYALSCLGLNDAVDLVYGSSAGAMVGAYFISRQCRSTMIYHDILPQAGRGFINKARLLDAAGISTHVVRGANPFKSFTSSSNVKSVLQRASTRLRHLKRDQLYQAWNNWTTSSNGSYSSSPQPSPSAMNSSSVLNLDFLLDNIMNEFQGFDWKTFDLNEKMQPLFIVASCAKNLNAVALSRKEGHFTDLPSLLNCIRASMLVPGVTDSLLMLRNESATPEKYFPITNTSSFLEIPSSYIKKYFNTTIPQNVSDISSRTLINNDTSLEPIHQRRSKFFPRRTIRWIQDWIVRTSTSRLPRIRPQLDSLSRYRSSVGFRRRRHKATSNSTIRDSYNSEFDRLRSSEQSSSYLLQASRRRSDLKSKRTRVHSFSRTYLEQNQMIGDGWWLERLPEAIEPSNDLSTTHSPLNISAILCDAFFCEPIPYRSAVRSGATHCIVLRTRPDPCMVLGTGPGPYEQIIARRFFGRYNASQAISWLTSMQHHRIYAEDVLLMNDAALGPVGGVNFGNRSVHLLPIAVVRGQDPEIGQLEMRRHKIYEGLRSGVRRVLEVFLPMILSLDDLPESMSPLLSGKIKAWRDTGKMTEDVYNDLAEEFSVESVLELLCPSSVVQKPPPPLSELLQSLSLNKGEQI